MTDKPKTLEDVLGKRGNLECPGGNKMYKEKCGFKSCGFGKQNKCYADYIRDNWESLNEPRPTAGT